MSNASASARTAACVGTRTLNPDQTVLLQKIAYQLVGAGWTLHTGGALGADQAFAQGAALALHHGASGHLVIHLPWPSYERAAADAAVALGGRDSVALDTPRTFSEAERAYAVRFHPAPEHLSRGGVTLMARNVRILFPDGPAKPSVSLVIALPSEKPGGGGTGHSLRLAESLGIARHDLLHDLNLRRRYVARCRTVALPAVPSVSPAGPALR